MQIRILLDSTFDMQIAFLIYKLKLIDHWFATCNHYNWIQNFQIYLSFCWFVYSDFWKHPNLQIRVIFQRIYSTANSYKCLWYFLLYLDLLAKTVFTEHPRLRNGESIGWYIPWNLTMAWLTTYSGVWPSGLT